MENILFLLLCTVPIIIPAGLFSLIQYRLSSKSRLPIDYGQSLRIPGFSLLTELKSLQFDVIAYVGLSATVTLIPFAQMGVYALFNREYKPLIFTTTITLLILGWFVVKIAKNFKRLQSIRLGLEAEWAVASELGQIREPNVSVFHDVQGDNFNIDHVVTSPNGIIAIETKGRRKPNSAAKEKSYRVTLKNDSLHFPHFTDKDTIRQAQRQSKWLKEKLLTATGEQNNVTPVVVIPGWFIEHKTKPSVLIWPLKKLRDNYRYGLKQNITMEQLQRVNHQLTILCQRNSDEF